jgi:hypothetical protein
MTIPRTLRHTAALFTALALPTAAATAQLSSPLELRVPKAPTVAAGEGGSFLVYELHLTNFSPVSVNLRRIDVLGAGAERILLTLQDSGLGRALARPGITAALVDRPRLGAGLRAVAYLWVPVEGQAPARVRHRVTVETGSGDSVRTRVVDGGDVVVASDVAVIGPPLKGTGWLSANGPSNESGHRRALIPIDGTPAIAQRFAIDYVQVDSAGRTFSGDRASNASYHAQGEDALAVMDGVVQRQRTASRRTSPASTRVPCRSRSRRSVGIM